MLGGNCPTQLFRILRGEVHVEVVLPSFERRTQPAADGDGEHLSSKPLACRSARQLEAVACLLRGSAIPAEPPSQQLHLAVKWCCHEIRMKHLCNRNPWHVEGTELSQRGRSDPCDKRSSVLYVPVRKLHAE